MLLKLIRNYVWNGWGEALRGVEVVIAVTILTSLTGIQSVTDWRTYLTGVGVAVIVAGAAYVKGRLPAVD